MHGDEAVLQEHGPLPLLLDDLDDLLGKLGTDDQVAQAFPGRGDLYEVGDVALRSRQRRDLGERHP